jgi:hypothetical protein
VRELQGLKPFSSDLFMSSLKGDPQTYSAFRACPLRRAGSPRSSIRERDSAAKGHLFGSSYVAPKGATHKEYPDGSERQKIRWAIPVGVAKNFWGRSEQRPYGILLRQGASGIRKREQAPALHRMASRRRLECGKGDDSRERHRERKALRAGFFVGAKAPTP